MIMVLGPHKKKSEARTERAADKARAAESAAADEALPQIAEA
jgi:hypothetical protein